MTTEMKTPVQAAGGSLLRRVLVSSWIAAAPVLALGAVTINDFDEMQMPAGHVHADQESSTPAKLVQLVRDATRKFIDVNMATAAGYGPFLGCITGPDRGAMGVHYVNGTLVGDGEIDSSRPEALIYEPSGDGMKLVGVEFIVDSATWLAHHDSPPVLEGQSFQLVNSPNRYGLPPFFELHVWAWRDNPHGAFVDWNTRVSCEGR